MLPVDFNFSEVPSELLEPEAIFETSNSTGFCPFAKNHCAVAYGDAYRDTERVQFSYEFN